MFHLSDEQTRQVLLFIVLPSAATTIVVLIAWHFISTIIATHRPAARVKWGDDWIWAGDLTPFRFVAENGRAVLYHACGWNHRIADGEYLSNLVVDEAMRHTHVGCAEYPLSGNTTATIPKHGRRTLPT